MSSPDTPHPLEARRFSIKFFVSQPFEAGLRAVVPVFHGWIQRRALDEDLLIDVADYAHVHRGPGILLIGHEAQYSFDEVGGRLGLRYSRRRRGEGSVTARLSTAFSAALRACRLLQDEPALAGKLRFRFDEIELQILDRLVSPTSPEAFQVVQEEMQRFLSGLYAVAAGIEIRPIGGAKDPLALHIQISPASAVPAVDTLLSRLESLVA